MAETYHLQHIENEFERAYDCMGLTINGERSNVLVFKKDLKGSRIGAGETSMVDSAREACGSVRVLRKDPKECMME